MRASFFTAVWIDTSILTLSPRNMAAPSLTQIQRLKGSIISLPKKDMVRLAFDLLKYENAINKLHDEVMYGFHMQDEILKLFPPREVVHRGITRLVSKPNMLDKSMIPHKSKSLMNEDMFRQTNVIECTEVIYKLTVSLVDQARANTLTVMFETGDAAGNTLNRKGQNIWETYIELLERLDYRFQGYKLFLGSDVIKNMLREAPTREQLERAKAVIEAKRQEFQAKKRVRRIT